MLKQETESECAIPISESLYLRLYPNTKPFYRHIASLQKGLILANHDCELVGEGTGFGVPVVRYRDKIYFASTSNLQILNQIDRTTVIKQFSLDITPEKIFRKVKIENQVQRRLSSHIAELYQKHQRWRHAFETLKLKHISKNMGFETTFVPTKSPGNVILTYRIDPPFIRVKADFRLLEKRGLQKIFMLNEQGSKYFRTYHDSDGITLFGEKIGTWENVEADWACMSNSSKKIGFRLWKLKGTILRRGIEFLKGSLDWVGLDYELRAQKAWFEYDIEIVGRRNHG